MQQRVPGRGGIYFLVPFPTGWELRAFRFGVYPDVGHALTWELVVAPQVALRWAATLYPEQTLDHTPALIAALNRQLSSLYDSVPRGRAAMPDDGGRRCHIYHGDDISAATGISKSEIESALGITRNRVWRYDEHETRNIDSTNRLAEILSLHQDQFSSGPNSSHHRPRPSRPRKTRGLLSL